MSSQASSPCAVSPALLYPLLSLSPQPKRWIVAYSGGVDSHVLLLLCQRVIARLETPPELVALHINHQLQDDADIWQRHCQQQAQQLGVTFVSESIRIICAPRQSLEEQARVARYACFERHVKAGDVLLLGHHQDDQAETVMLRLLRGSGSKGLQAMREQRAIAAGQLHRPLLKVERQVIEAFAKRERLAWIEDPSNQQQHFDRNFLRATCLPLIERRWPGYRQALSRVANLSAESWELQQQLAILDFERFGWLPEQPSLPIEPLITLNPARQKNLLRYWLSQRNLPMPSAGQLEQVLSTVIDAAVDAEPLVTWPGVDVRRFAGYLFCMKALPAFDGSQCFAIKNTELLLKKGCKLIVVACNTATTNAIDYLRETYKVPFIGIEPAIKPAALQTKTNAVGILATKGTLSSELFSKTSTLFANNINVIEQIGDGIVELVENGKLQSESMNSLLKVYLEPMIKANIDYLVLGCTHYPYLIPMLRKLLPEQVKIIDSGEAVARQTKAVLERLDLLNKSTSKINPQFFTNKNPEVMASLLKQNFEIDYLDF